MEDVLRSIPTSKPPANASVVSASILGITPLKPVASRDSRQRPLIIPPPEDFISRLPAAVRMTIFAYIRLRPRICVVSIVCKRWRKDVLSCPLSLTDMSLSTAHLSQALVLMKCVTKVPVH